MKKKLSSLFLVLGLVLFFSCTDDDSQVEKVQGSKVSSFIVSPDSAIAISNQAIRAISENSETRSSQSKRQVNSVKLVNLASNVATRSQNGNAINSSLYIINYKDNKGFAIVSSDKRLRPLYAISDTGNIAISDTITNKSLALFFHGVESDMGSVASDTLLLSNSGGNGYFYLNNGQLGGSASLFAGGDNGNQATNKYTDLQYIANFRINRDKERVNL